MSNRNIVDLKTFIPAKDYERSKAFYQDMGFDMASDTEGVAFFRNGPFTFLLQDFYQQQHSENFMMHLQVEDVASWHEHLIASDMAGKYNVKITDLISQPWGMLEFCLTDPSGVLWRIAQNQ